MFRRVLTEGHQLHVECDASADISWDAPPRGLDGLVWYHGHGVHESKALGISRISDARHARSTRAGMREGQASHLAPEPRMVAEAKTKPEWNNPSAAVGVEMEGSMCN